MLREAVRHFGCTLEVDISSRMTGQQMRASKASKTDVPTVLWPAEAGGTRGYNGASLLPIVYLMEGGAEYYDERSSFAPSERVSSETGKEVAVSVA